MPVLPHVAIFRRLRCRSLDKAVVSVNVIGGVSVLAVLNIATFGPCRSGKSLANAIDKNLGIDRLRLIPTPTNLRVSPTCVPKTPTAYYRPAALLIRCESSEVWQLHISARKILLHKADAEPAPLELPSGSIEAASCNSISDA